MTLQELGIKHHTDKATVHSYLPLYEERLGLLREEPLALLELGVWVGDSLRMWLEYFPKAEIHGADAGSRCETKDPRLHLHLINVVDEGAIRAEFWEHQFDVIIDDASHKYWDQILSFHYLWQCLKPGGWYFVEDVQCAKNACYWFCIPWAQIHTLHKDGRWDDILIAVQKPALV